MKSLSEKSLEVWFLTGSQPLYGEDILAQVAEQSKQVVATLNAASDLPIKATWKPVLTTPEAIKALCLEASANPNCIGVITWMHTFSAAAPEHLQILGDDLFTTNLHRLERGIAEKSANAILIKANQNGLLTSTHRVLDHAHADNFATVVSARSGETEDSWLADIATGWRAQQIKAGSTHGSERTAKWNRLLELEATEETEFAKPFKAL